jgi:hypothetical protein
MLTFNIHKAIKIIDEGINVILIMMNPIQVIIHMQ